MELTRSLEHKSGEVVTLLNLGTTYELLNKLDQAIEWYTLVSRHTQNLIQSTKVLCLCVQYLSLTVQREDVQGQARGLCILASLYQETKQLMKAHEYYKRVSSACCTVMSFTAAKKIFMWIILHMRPFHLDIHHDMLA